MTAATLTPPAMNGAATPAKPGPTTSPEQVLQTLADRHAATDKSNAWRKRFQLARAIRGIEEGIAGGRLEQRYAKFVFDQWFRLSQQHLDQDKTDDDHYTGSKRS